MKGSEVSGAEGEGKEVFGQTNEQWLNDFDSASASSFN